MTSSRVFRFSGGALLVGAAAFVVHLVARSAITAGADLATVAKQGLWQPINALGVVGAALVLLGMPGMYARMGTPAGALGLLGVTLIALAWLFFGIFLSLFSLLIAPWLADRAPSLLVASEPQPAAILAAFLVSLVAQTAGVVLLAIPFLRGRMHPRWIGWALPASAFLTVLGDLLAPSGPSSNLALNLLSNSGPMLLLIVLGAIGLRMRRGPSPTMAP